MASMIQSFANGSTQDIYDGINSKKARKPLSVGVFSVARRKLDMLDAAHSLNDLRVPPSNHLETLKGDLQSRYSIRINDQYRIIFRWTDQGAEEVAIVDYS